MTTKKTRMTYEKASDLYKLLKDKWGVRKQAHSYTYRKGNYRDKTWMPVLKPGWIRPTLREFLNIYNIELEE